MCNRPVKGLSRLLRGISSNQVGDFYCLNCFNPYNTENRLKEHEEICNKNDNCRIIMPMWNEELLKHNHGKKLLKDPFVICLDLECLLLKMHSCQNNLENSYTEKKAKHEPSGWTIFTNCSFDKTKNKHDYYRGIDCIEVYCKKLKEHALEKLTMKKKK